MATATSPSGIAGNTAHQVLGPPIDDLTLEETLDVVDQFVASHRVHQHVVVNVTKVVQADRDPALRAILEACDLVNADGQPIVWAARWLGTPLRERVAGIDLMTSLFARAATRGHRMYLLGARGSVVEAVAARIEAEHPAAIVAGWHDGYWRSEDEPALAAGIAETRPDILFLAIPSPAKEHFLARWKDTIGASFVMGVGGSFDVYAGSSNVRLSGCTRRSGVAIPVPPGTPAPVAAVRERRSAVCPARPARPGGPSETSVTGRSAGARAWGETSSSLSASGSRPSVRAF